MKRALVMAAAVAAQLSKDNDFSTESIRIPLLIQDLAPLGKTPFLLYLGDGLKKTVTETGFLLGDPTDPYFEIISHGADLEGVVLVSLSSKVARGHHVVVLNVEPLGTSRFNLAGTIWMDDIQNPGFCPILGTTAVFSQESLYRPLPHPSWSAFNGTIHGLSFGLVLFSCDVDSFQVLGEMFAKPRVITPMGVSQDLPAGFYPFSGHKLNHRPEEMSGSAYRILKIIFREGLGAFSEQHASDLLHASELTPEEICEIITFLRRMIDHGWFFKYSFKGLDYFVPTIKLLLAVR